MLFRFGIQKAFENACLMGHTALVREFTSASSSGWLFLHEALIIELVLSRRKEALSALFELGKAIPTIKGENIDPTGICGTLLYQD